MNEEGLVTPSATLNILEEILSVRNHLESTDVLLVTDDGTSLPAHKAILSATSEYFRALFCGTLTAQSGLRPTREVVLKGVSEAPLSSLLDYMYSGRLWLTDVGEVISLLIVADMLIVPEAVEACEEFLCTQITMQSCFTFHDLTKRCYCPFLQDQVRKFLLRHLHALSYFSTDFERLSADDLQSFLSADDLRVRHEEHALNIVFRWIEADMIKRKPFLSHLMKFVRLPLCNIEYLLELLRSNELVKENKAALVQVETAVSLLLKQISKSEIPSHMFCHRKPAALIVVIGGLSTTGVTNEIEIFNPNTNKWIKSPHKDSEYKSAYHGVVKLNRFVYILGGFDGARCTSTVRCFDLERLKWAEAAPMHSPRCYGAFAAFDHFFIIAAGGCDGRSRLDLCEWYDSTCNVWMSIAPMKEPRSDASALQCKGVVFVAGGTDGVKVLSSVEMYQPEANVWTDVTPMTSPRSGLCLLCTHSCILALGGSSGTKRLRTVERFDIQNRTWSVVSKMRLGRSNFQAVIAGNQIYAIGGYHATSEPCVRSAEKIHLKYCQASKRSFASWHFVPSLLTKRRGHCGCVVTGSHVSSMLKDCT